MIRPVRCIHCGSSTRTVYKSIQSKFRQSTIILNQAPMHYCHNCNENLISLEALSALRHLKSMPLKIGVNEFDFNSVSARAKLQKGAS